MNNYEEEIYEYSDKIFKNLLVLKKNIAYYQTL